MKTKSTLFNLLIRKTSKFLCYERLLNMTYVAYKNAFFRETQFWSHCYTVVSYQALFRLLVYKIPAVYLSGAKNVRFCTIRDFGSSTRNLNSFLASAKFCCLLKTFENCLDPDQDRQNLDPNPLTLIVPERFFIKHLIFKKVSQ